VAQVFNLCPALAAAWAKEIAKPGICMPTNLERINKAVKIALRPWSFS
jgi:hypothetical protein